MSEPLIVLTGPTAVGKTSLSLALAEHLDAEIISADSRQIYRQLDIGTAKPTPAERARVPHHFIDELDLDVPFSAGQFARAATERIQEIKDRGRVPLVVGGATLYLHALQGGLAEIPAIAPAVRAQMTARLAAEGPTVLFAELRRIDPVFADTLDVTKTQRLLRGLEVYHGTGRPLSAFFADRSPPPFQFRTIVLHRERAALYERINQRVDQMLAAGLLDEVANVLAQGIEPTTNPLRTIGYREPIQYLQGTLGFEEMVRLIKRNTRRYAKRQRTWLRRYSSFEWFSYDAITDLDVLLHHRGHPPSSIV